MNPFKGDVLIDDISEFLMWLIRPMCTIDIAFPFKLNAIKELQDKDKHKTRASMKQHDEKVTKNFCEVTNIHNTT